MNINIVIGGVGGQGVILMSKVLASVLLKAGYDVKYSEVHGMSQRGGSVKTEVRYGEKVYSPLIGQGEAHYVILLSETEREVLKPYTSDKTIFLQGTLESSNSKYLNMYLLGKFSKYLDIDINLWFKAVEELVSPTHQEINKNMFSKGRQDE